MNKGNTLIKNVNYYDTQTDKISVGSIVVDNGLIMDITPETDGFREDLHTVIEGRGQLYFLPGFCDLHAHFRDFNENTKETIESGAAAAWHGGFTSVATMPNTNPCTDNSAIVKEILRKSASLPIDIYPVAALTKQREGEVISEMFFLKEAGAVAFSDDGTGVANSEIMLNALKYASMTNLPVLCHCEENSLKFGHVNEGVVSSRWGIQGNPAVSESIAAFRDISLAEYIGTSVHICHVSSKLTVEIIRQAKARGVKVTAETAPHYLALNEEVLLENLNGNFKMNPPLRGEQDRIALIEAIKDGTIDAVATDHAPHGAGDKQNEFELAKFGVTGLETAFSVVSDILYHQNGLPVEKIVEVMAINPRKILNIAKVEIKKGKRVDAVLVDFNEKVKCDTANHRSMSKNSPFSNMEFKGNIVAVFKSDFFEVFR